MPDDSYELTTLETSGATSVALSPDGSRLYVAKSDGMIDVFDVATRSKVATWDIGTQLGGMSISEDGSFLLVAERTGSVPPGAPPGYPPTSSLLYRVDTASGSFTSYAAGIVADVEIVDDDTAIITGGSSQVTRLNLITGIFTTIANGVYYANNAVLTEDRHLTLLAEIGISNGPLKLYDDRTDTIVAAGDNYQTIGTGSGNIGFNYGHQAVSEAAGLVAQFVYHGTINLFDLSLHFLRALSISGPVDGLAFDPSGTYLFVRLTDGPLLQYVAATGTLVESFALDATQWHNNPGAGDQITFGADGKTIFVHDNNTGKLQLIDLHPRDQQIDGTTGADALAGGRGDDTYTVDHTGDTVTELPLQGDDSVRASVDFTLPAEVENLELTGTAINGIGNALRNYMIGNAQGNTLDGGGENDWLAGGDGNDTLLGGEGDDSLVGMAGDDTLWGQAGDDMLDGGAGNDALHGGDGNDLAVVASRLLGEDPGSDFIDFGPGNDRLLAYGQFSAFADGGTGIDRVELTATDGEVIDGSTLGGFEQLQLSGDGQFVNFSGYTSIELGAPVGWERALVQSDNPLVDLALVGNALRLAGSTLHSISGGALDERVELWGASVVSQGVDLGGGNDQLVLARFPGGATPALPGGGAQGGAGTDTLYLVSHADGVMSYDLAKTGGFERLLLNANYGYDVDYTISHAGSALQFVWLGQGISLALSATNAPVADLQGGFGGTIELAADVTIGRYGYATGEGFLPDSEREVADATQSVQLTNRGTVVEDVWLYTGNDTYDGATGTVGGTVHGNAGDDRLIGGAASDTLLGGAGSDSLAGGASQDWLQGGAGADTAVGGTDHDSVWGGTGDDVLDGGDGDDTLVGNDGIDTVTYAAASSGVEVDLSWIEDQNTRGAGTDTLLSIENLVGSGLADVLKGSMVANRLTGGAGADVLSGGAGNDVFAYLALSDSTATNADQITDFEAGKDRIDVSAIDADSGTAGDQAFHLGATAGHAGDVVLAYDAGSGRTSVSFFVDGDAVADMVVLLDGNHLGLGAGDFVL